MQQTRSYFGSSNRANRGNSGQPKPLKPPLNVKQCTGSCPLLPQAALAEPNSLLLSIAVPAVPNCLLESLAPIAILM